MDYQKLYDLYFLLPRMRGLGLIGKVVDRILIRTIKPSLEKKFLSILENPGKNQIKNDPEIIVSLTSFPARIESIWITIESITRQSIPPNRILLYLSLEQFPDRRIPGSLNKLVKQGKVEVRYVEGDIRSHKKYFYAFQEFVNAWIITFDDDVYYPFDAIQKLVNTKKKFNDCVICNRAHVMKNHGDGFLPYREWEHNAVVKHQPSFSLMPTGVGGVLYESRFFSDDIFSKSLFTKLTPFADDIWLKVMSVKNEVEVALTSGYSRDFISVGDSQKERLLAYNSKSGGNDEQLKAALNHFNLSVDDFE